MAAPADLTSGTVELLQAMVRAACVNDGTPESGHEHRNADILVDYLDGVGLDVERYEPLAGRTSIITRIDGHDPDAPSLCLLGHTDVVPVNAEAWSRDPFGGELVDGEVWGRGAVDMLNLTASMAVAVRHLASRGWRPRGDLVLAAVADEESGSTHGARWLADHAADHLGADYVLTESGGLHSGPEDRPFIGVNVGEKGVSWRRLTVRGTPGHGSRPYGADNALVTAAEVVRRLSEYRPAPSFHELWQRQVDTLSIPPELADALRDPDQIDDVLDELGDDGAAGHLHACTHTTFSVNRARGGTKVNVIPDVVELDLDARTLPGETAADVTAHLRAALGDELSGAVEVRSLLDDPATVSPTDTPLWESLQKAVAAPFPGARLSAQLTVGFTDARVARSLGAVAYGAGLFHPSVPPGDFARRFHGNDERIDVESLGLTTRLWLDVATDLLGG